MFFSTTGWPFPLPELSVMKKELSFARVGLIHARKRRVSLSFGLVLGETIVTFAKLIPFPHVHFNL